MTIKTPIGVFLIVNNYFLWYYFNRELTTFLLWKVVLDEKTPKLSIVIISRF